MFYNLYEIKKKEFIIFSFDNKIQMQGAICKLTFFLILVLYLNKI